MNTMFDDNEIPGWIGSLHRSEESFPTSTSDWGEDLIKAVFKPIILSLMVVAPRYDDDGTVDVRWYTDRGIAI